MLPNESGKESKKNPEYSLQQRLSRNLSITEDGKLKFNFKTK